MRLWPAAIGVIVLISLACLPAYSHAAPAQIMLKGTVFLEGSNLTLVGINVDLCDANGAVLNTTMTDGSGRFEFLCSPDSLVLNFTHNAFLTRSFPVDVGEEGLDGTFGLQQAPPPFAIYAIKIYNYTQMYDNITDIDCRTDFLFKFDTLIDPSSFSLTIFSDKEEEDVDQQGIVSGNLTYYSNNNTMKFKPSSQMANQRLQDYPTYHMIISSDLNDSSGEPLLYFDFHLWFVNAELDTDRDKMPDYRDPFPFDPTEWLDTDTDGVGDNKDAFRSDNTQWKDSDGDGYGDNQTGNDPDLFPQDSNEWWDSDGDGIGDNEETDDDNDGFNDTVETQLGCDPRDASSKPKDLDGDGIPDALDSDADGDGYSNDEEQDKGTDPYDKDSHPTFLSPVTVMIIVIALLFLVLLVAGGMWVMSSKHRNGPDAPENTKGRRSGRKGPNERNRSANNKRKHVTGRKR